MYETRYGRARAPPLVSDANNTIDRWHSVSCMSCMLGACVQARLEAKHDKELWAVAEQVKELLGTRGWR